MNNFYKMTLEGARGVISSIAQEACEIAKEKNIDVQFTFNGVKVNITPRSEPTAVSTVALKAVKDGHKEIYC